MPYCEWDDDNLESLINAIECGNCILMMGAGVSLEKDGDEFLPCTEILARNLAEDIKNETEQWNINPDTSNLAQVAQYYDLIKGKNKLQSSVKKFYAKRKNAGCEIYRNLSALPFSNIITTAHDQMFYNALKKRQKEPIIKHFNFCEKNRIFSHKGSRDAPLIFQLYGTIKKPDSMILKEDDFLNFLTGDHSLQDNIIELLKDKKKSILFLGFGFQYWYSRVLLHFLKTNKKDDKSFAFEHPVSVDGGYDNDDLKRTIIFFKKSDYKIKFFKNDLFTFTKNLKEKYLKELLSDSDDAVDLPPRYPANKSVVFICHASEDSAKATEIYNGLKITGFDPWQDKENLRGGDEWDTYIKKTIQKCDYFLVLQSKALFNKTFSYVNKEINIALDMQKYCGQAKRFIIPVKIEECELLERLKFLHTVDISEGKDYSKLIEDLKSNLRKRQGDNV
jgi:hypothetical protein